MNVEPQLSTHFKHSIWLDNASNSIVFICEVLSLCCLHAIWCRIVLLGSFFGCPSLRHLIIFLIYVLMLAVSISRLSPLIDRAIIFLLSFFFFLFVRLYQGHFMCIWILLTHFRPAWLLSIFLYRYLQTLAHFNERRCFYQCQLNESMISILILP